MDKQLIVIILNWNNAPETLACLHSLAQSDYAAYEVLVVDNHSSDDSVNEIRAAFPHIDLLELPENLGYTGGNNLALQKVIQRRIPWTLVLNNDTIVAPDMLTQIMAVAQANPTLGIVGPMVYHMEPPHLIQSAGGLLDGAWRATHRAQNQPEVLPESDLIPVDWISGCAFLIRTEVLESIGLFDESYYAYWEEVDLCIRTRRAGWQIGVVPAARIWHSGVQPDYRPKPYVTYYTVRNRLMLLRKNQAPPWAKIIAWTDTLRTLTSWSLRPKWRHMRTHRNTMWLGVTDFLRNRAGMMPERPI